MVFHDILMSLVVLGAHPHPFDMESRMLAHALLQRLTSDLCLCLQYEDIVRKSREKSLKIIRNHHKSQEVIRIV